MGFSNERMRTGQLVNWFLLDGLELTPAGYPVTQALSLPFGVDHLIGFNELLTCKHPENAGVHFSSMTTSSSDSGGCRSGTSTRWRSARWSSARTSRFTPTSPRPSSTGTTTGTSC